MKNLMRLWKNRINHFENGIVKVGFRWSLRESTVHQKSGNEKKKWWEDGIRGESEQELKFSRLLWERRRRQGMRSLSGSETVTAANGDVAFDVGQKLTDCVLFLECRRSWETRRRKCHLQDQVRRTVLLIAESVAAIRRSLWFFWTPTSFSKSTES